MDQEIELSFLISRLAPYLVAHPSSAIELNKTLRSVPELLLVQKVHSLLNHYYHLTL